METTKTGAGLTQYVTASEIAEAYKVSKNYVWKLSRSGELPGRVLAGGRIKRFAVEDVERVFGGDEVA